MPIKNAKELFVNMLIIRLVTPKALNADCP
jgi:hypothetical protein